MGCRSSGFTWWSCAAIAARFSGFMIFANSTATAPTTGDIYGGGGLDVYISRILGGVSASAFLGVSACGLETAPLLASAVSGWCVEGLSALFRAVLSVSAKRHLKISCFRFSLKSENLINPALSRPSAARLVADLSGLPPRTPGPGSWYNSSRKLCQLTPRFCPTIPLPKSINRRMTI